MFLYFSPNQVILQVEYRACKAVAAARVPSLAKVRQRLSQLLPVPVRSQVL